MQPGIITAPKELGSNSDDHLMCFDDLATPRELPPFGTTRLPTRSYVGIPSVLRDRGDAGRSAESEEGPGGIRPLSNGYI